METPSEKGSICLGRGSFSEVFLIKQGSGDSLIARKIFKQDKINSKYIHREFDNLRKLKDSYGFIKMISSEDDMSKLDMDFLPGGTLSGLIKTTKNNISIDGFDTTQELILAYGIAYLMSKLHEKNMIHRDLKPGNVMLDHNLYSYIGDFNLSREHESDANRKLTRCGTANYLPPEMVQHQPSFTSKSDVFMYGMTLYEMVELKPPYDNLSSEAIAHRIYNHLLPALTEKHLLNDIIVKCWAFDPINRPTMMEIASEIAAIAHQNNEIDTQRFDAYVQLLKDESKGNANITCGSLANLYEAAKKGIPFSIYILQQLRVSDMADDKEKQNIQRILDHCNDDATCEDEEEDEEEEITI